MGVLPKVDRATQIDNRETWGELTEDRRLAGGRPLESPVVWALPITESATEQRFRNGRSSRLYESMAEREVFSEEIDALLAGKPVGEGK
jgi:hypothetical protein